MTDVGYSSIARPSCAAIFGASGGIGSAMTQALAEQGMRVWAGSRRGDISATDLVTPFAFDLDDEASIATAAHTMHDDPPELIIVATGTLTLPDGTGPERSYKALDGETMARIMRLNAIGPALIAKYMLPLLPRDRRAVFAALSARVGSIEDNGMGGWHSYRASKTALNMLLKNFAIEIGRTHKRAVVVGLHPGTVDSDLSKPFQGNVPDSKLFTPEYSAKKLLAVLNGLTPANSGGVFDWAGERIPS